VPVLLVSALVAAVLLAGLAPRALHWSQSAGPTRSPGRLGSTSRTGRSAAQQTTLTVEPGRPGGRFALGTIGLSIEAEELATPDLTDRHRSLVALMRQLGPGVLRIAGASLDYSWWTSQSEQPPEWATDKAASAAVVTPADLYRLRGLLTATGWRVILGLNLAHFEPPRAANEAAFAERILGSHLLGLEPGNEPNYYGGTLYGFRPGSYGVDNYLEEISAYSAAIHAAAPTVRLDGPDLGGKAQTLQTWLPAVASIKPMPFAAITQHYYPTQYNNSKSRCEASPEPTAVELLSPQVRERENAVLRAIVGAGQIAHRETRITETNTTGSCQSSDGPSTSPVFASALWALDWSLRSASAGIAGLNFHGYFGICAPDGYNPICAPNATAERGGEVTARPEYYGLLAARQLEGGNFIPVHIGGPDDEGDLVAYATQHRDGSITVAIENLNPQTSVSLLVKAPRRASTTDERLTAPSLGSTSGVTFGHASLDAAGAIQPKVASIHNAHGTFHIGLAPSSAAIVTLRR
jgi:hypothetical protein